MKIILIAAALIVSTPVFAQDMPTAPAPDSTAASATNAAPAATPTPVDSASLPKCSRTVKDKCIQAGALHKHRK